MKKITIFSFVFSMLTACSFAQQDKTKETIKSAANDPQRVENSGKADVYVQDKTTISNDETLTKSKQMTATTDKRKKKKTCKKGSCCKKA